jgi:hypothetical protein
MTMITGLRTSKRTLSSLGLAALLAILPATAAFAQTQNARPGAGFSVPVTGTTTAGADPSQTLAGTLTIQRFARQNGSLVAVGTVVATVTDTTKNDAVSTLVTPVTLSVNRSTTTATCEILHLVLGPLNLTLLGLDIQLNEVVLDITAVPGAGNLLGNLLCAVGGVLDGAAPAAEIVSALNNLLAAL